VTENRTRGSKKDDSQITPGQQQKKLTVLPGKEGPLLALEAIGCHNPPPMKKNRNRGVLAQSRNRPALVIDMRPKKSSILTEAGAKVFAEKAAASAAKRPSGREVRNDQVVIGAVKQMGRRR